MSTAIAFLSGKGGSGKTTLALSIADLLSRCEVKTLLIDCDLSTNGATYFYESRLANREQRSDDTMLSFSDYLYTEKVTTIETIHVNSHFDFIPSISAIPDPQFEKNAAHSFLRLDIKLDALIGLAKKKYDIILLDCQAGYTELLPALLPLMDRNLFVLEADSVSASAMRNLYLKIGSSLRDAKIYQVFNKASPEEYEIYSKIVGTFFVNIGTFLFDWKIRQTISRSQIPDIENTSASYGLDLCETCRIMISNTEIQEKINTLSDSIRSRKEREEDNGEGIRKKSPKDHNIGYIRYGIISNSTLLNFTTMGIFILILSLLLYVLLLNESFQIELELYNINPFQVLILSRVMTLSGGFMLLPTLFFIMRGLIVKIYQLLFG